MGHDALNKKIRIPDLPRNPHVWDTPPADTLYNDHLIDPLADERQREDWLSGEIDSNPMVSEEKDIEESRYGSKLGSLAVGLKDDERRESKDEEDEQDSDEEKDDEEDE